MESTERIEVSWVCAECGRQRGNRIPESCTWHEGKCDVCGRKKPVTQGRDWGVYVILPKEFNPV